MIKLPEELPIKKHHTMAIVDSSKIQSFQDCPRGFFFSYVLGLRPEGSNIHLDFGSAWHDAMEHLLLEGYSEESVEEAFKKFMIVFREAFPDDITDQDKAPKNPEYAYKALKQYAKQYQLDHFEVLYTETAGLVSVREDREIVVKLDSIVRDLHTGKVNSMEHKTTGYNSASWRDKWKIMFQIKAYTHLLYSLYPEEEVGAVIVNGSVFTKSRGWEGIRIPVHQTKAMMAAFLWEANHWIDQIEWNYQQLAKCSPDDAVMSAFPINCMSCSKFGCRMGGICATFPNPLRFAEEGIAGYEVDYWDPLRRNLEKADNVITKDEESGGIKIVEKSKELDEELKKESAEEKARKEQQDADDFDNFVL